MATPSSILAWRIPWTEEPDGLQSMGVAKSWIQLSNFHSLTPLFCPLPGSEPAAAGWIGTFNVLQKGLQTLEDQDGLPLLPLLAPLDSQKVLKPLYTLFSKDKLTVSHVCLADQPLSI